MADLGQPGYMPVDAKTWEQCRPVLGPAGPGPTLAERQAIDAGTRQRERMGAMSNPGAKQFQQVKIVVEVWVDPELADTTAWIVADNIQITAVNAVEAAMKEIEAPDHGVEIVVKS